MISLATKSAEDTRELGVALATLVVPSDVILLAGDLGSGKTTFAQGLARGLEVVEQVTSPTFVLMHSYTGRVELCHVDAYRLDQLQEVIELGLPEFLDDGAVAMIEWGDVVAPVLPLDFLEVRFDYRDSDDERSIQVRWVGARWSARQSAVRQVLERWCTP